MKKRRYGLRTAILFPIMILLLGIMEYTKHKDLVKLLTMFIPSIIIVMIWFGTSHNLIIIVSDKLIVKSAYYPWVKTREIEFEKIHRVFVDGGTRYGGRSFTCFLKDENIFEFCSRTISRSDARKIAKEIEGRGIDVETNII